MEGYKCRQLYLICQARIDVSFKADLLDYQILFVEPSLGSQRGFLELVISRKQNYCLQSLLGEGMASMPEVVAAPGILVDLLRCTMVGIEVACSYFHLLHDLREEMMAAGCCCDFHFLEYLMVKLELDYTLELSLVQGYHP